MSLFDHRWKQYGSRFSPYKGALGHQQSESAQPDAHTPELPGPVQQDIYDRWHAHYQEAQQQYQEPDPWFEDPPTSTPIPPRNRPPRDRSEQEAQPDLGELGYVPLTQDVMEILHPEIPEVPRKWEEGKSEDAMQARLVALEEELGATDRSAEEVESEKLENLIEGGDGQLVPTPGIRSIDDPLLLNSMEAGQEMLGSAQERTETLDEGDVFVAMQGESEPQMSQPLGEQVGQDQMREDPLEAQERMYDEMRQMMDPMMPGPYGSGPGPGFGPMPGP